MGNPIIKFNVIPSSKPFYYFEFDGILITAFYIVEPQTNDMIIKATLLTIPILFLSIFGKGQIFKGKEAQNIIKEAIFIEYTNRSSNPIQVFTSIIFTSQN